jgi:hypothetical protein
MSGVEGAEREDYDECEVGIGELQEHEPLRAPFDFAQGRLRFTKETVALLV